VKTVVVVGSANVDFVMKMDRLPAVGETVTDALFFQSFGGKGANQAVAAARAGAETWFVACVGGDELSRSMVASWSEAGVRTGHVTEVNGVPSGAALVMVGRDGANYLSVAPGANYRMAPEHVLRALPVLARASIAVLQNEVPQSVIERTIECARAAGVRILWNYAPARHLPSELLGSADIVVVNETEASFLSGSGVRDRDSASEAARTVRTLGAASVIVTLGGQGSVICDASGISHVPAMPVDAVDTTAAGDVFCGALAVALAEGRSTSGAVRFASAAAAICVTRLGAQPSAPRRDEIDDLLGR
jgi:ribokinase